MFRKASVCICVSMFNKALDKEAYKSCMYLFHEVCAKTDVLLKITRRTGVQFDRRPFSNSRAQLCEVPLHSSKWKINVKWQQGIQVYKHELTPKYTKREVCNYVLLALTQEHADWQGNDDCFQTGYGLGLVLGLNSPFTSHDTTNI